MIDKEKLQKELYPKYLNEQINKENIEKNNLENWYKKGKFCGYTPLDFEEFSQKFSTDIEFAESIEIFFKIK